MQTFQRCLSVQESRPVSPFVSMAERVQRFQQKTPERFHMLPSGCGSSQLVEIEKPKPLKLTRPKTPELGTMQRMRPSRYDADIIHLINIVPRLSRYRCSALVYEVTRFTHFLTILSACRVKSSAEIEEEMMANLPKFKARPLPKKVGLNLLSYF